MTRSETNRDDIFLDALFQEERAARNADMPEVSADLLARVLGDAETIQAGFDNAPLPERKAAALRPGFWAQVSAAIGGWPALAGLVTASVCGLWLGISPPSGLSDTAALYYTDELAMFDPMSGFDFDLEEG
ncbi:hypothetical protein Q4577_01955 [Marinovum sp. 2_MG-2023]|uniref:hypothetical protein n=1 Tax=unclassified Marinovum TaxID=2647166 RepID=UPI0026E1F53A|nr:MULTISPECIES: hypothetical protein [unclassified Marinovum]MDO6728763.1 hypothetical protein [Marinovum sp. 2_MG-2023]MDO6777821.1 hypothetical protein [Marinovum sp. 1_MG-2023]